MRYKVYGEEVISAKNPTDLVQQLTDTSMMKVASPAAFRLRAAFWEHHLSGRRIRVSTDDAFVDDMIKEGLLEVVP